MTQNHLGICLDGGLLRPHSLDNHEGEQGNIQRMQGGVRYATKIHPYLFSFCWRKNVTWTCVTRLTATRPSCWPPASTR